MRINYPSMKATPGNLLATTHIRISFHFVKSSIDPLTCVPVLEFVCVFLSPYVAQIYARVSCFN